MDWALMDNMLVFQSKNEQVYGLLKNKIVRGELKPGEAIVIDTLAKQLGVSQIPIREALRHLEAIGFIHIAPYVGARVTEIRAGSIYEVFALLEDMEVLSGRAACQTMTGERGRRVAASHARQLSPWLASATPLHRPAAPRHASMLASSSSASCSTRPGAGRR